MKLLIDGDIYLYRHAYAVEQAFDWGDDLHTIMSDAREGRQAMEADFAAIRSKLGVGQKDVILCFTGHGNFRKEIYPDYKADRTARRKPLAWRGMKAWFLESKEYEVAMRDMLEADDLMGIMSTRNPGECVIVSTDKDMKSIPGLLFNPDLDTFPTEISEEEANRWHMLQTLTGDQTDHYPGLPGCGPVGAEKILSAVPSNPGAMWVAVASAFLKKGLTLEDAAVQAKLARILRHGDWDFKKGCLLWSPPAVHASSSV